MARFDHLLLVCTNAGKAGDSKVRCGARGADALLDRLKACARERPPGAGKVRVTRSGCLDLCAKGIAVLALAADGPGTGLTEHWYTQLTPDDAEATFQAELARGAAARDATDG